MIELESIDHVALLVRDVERSARWYEEVLGLRRVELKQRGITFEFQDHQAAHSIYFKDPDGHQLEITTYDIPARDSSA